MTLWRIYQAAARADARALRLLPPGVKVTATDLDAAVADAEYLAKRERSNKRVRAWRENAA